MTDSQNNKEMIAIGHEFARSISSDTPIIEIAKMITRLAGRLDCATLALREMTKQRDALAAENPGLKAAISCHAAGFTVCEACGEENIFGNYDVCRALNETPATDAFLAEVRASALDEFASAQDEQAKKYYEMSPGCSAQDECQFAAGKAWYFAKCIRKGEQS